MRPSLPVLAFVASITACGGSPPKPAPPTTVPVGSAAARPPNEVAPALRTHGASAAVLAAWPLDEAPIVVYADLEGLFKTPLFAGLAKIIGALPVADVPAAQRKCAEDAIAAARELAFGSDGRQSIVVARLDPSAAPAVGACLGASTGSTATRVPGATSAWITGRDVIAVGDAGIVVSGARPLVERALAGGNGGATLARVGLAADEYVAWSASVPVPGLVSHGTLLVSPERFRVAGDAELPNETIAAKVEEELRPKRLADALAAQRADPATAETLAHLLESFQLRRDGRRLVAAFELREPPVDQARDLGIMASMAIASVRQYVSRSKQAEARNVLGQLAKIVVASWEAEDGKPRKTRKLRSFPPVPSAVPRGVKYASTDADWKAWAPLRFSMTAPQYYQYEIKAAKDGESAQIIAHGDLDGDGVVSTFTLDVVVRRAEDRILVAPAIQESHPDE
jgi:hypothetical protein